MKTKTFYTAQLTNDLTERELKNRDIAYKTALEGIVLLTNKENCLPFKNNKVALFGAGGMYTIKGGTGSGEVNERYNVTIYDGLKNKGFEVSNISYLNDYKKVYDEEYKKYQSKHINLFNINEALSESFVLPNPRIMNEKDKDESETENAIYIVSRQAGEGSDKKIERGEFNLSNNEIDDIKMMAKLYKNSVLVINSGSYMDIDGLEKTVKSIVYFAQQGEEGGNAFASIIKGETSPSAKLSDSWAIKYDDVPNAKNYSYLSGDTSNEFYNEGIYVGYRYYDTFNVKTKFPFGYGLSYTTFEIKALSLKKEKDAFDFEVEVINTGNYKGKEVVEVYASLPDGTLKKEYKRLIAFKKTKLLLPSEKEILTISFNAYNLSSFDEITTSYILDKGLYTIKYGNSSDNLTSYKNIKVDDLLVIEKCKSITTLNKKMEELAPSIIKKQESELDYVILDKNDISLKEYRYNSYNQVERKDVKTILDSLTINELVDVVVGEGIGGMIATSGIYSPGSVGRTTSKLFNKGLINVNLSDGPAGLRLLKESALNKTGKLKMVEGCYLIEFMNRMPKIIKKIMTPKKNDLKLYQYTTAFPVGTSLAQTFNTELVEEVGKAISSEMSEYSITYFLGPAMNIHKNPLCGRNFEYYSEDPLLSGKIAAAMIKGIESIKGNYATIKHFACNNVEDNRNRSDSHLTERTLREIYLKGFEIAIKEAKPSSVMTSYNLINGIYTPNHKGILIDALRNEWGFDKVVMTDWFSTSKGLGKNDIAIKNGNDLIMPGSKQNKREIVTVQSIKFK